MEWYLTQVRNERQLECVDSLSIRAGTEEWMASKDVGLTVEKPFMPWKGMQSFVWCMALPQ